MIEDADIIERIGSAKLKRVTGCSSAVLTNWRARGIPRTIDIRGPIAAAFRGEFPEIDWDAFLGLKPAGRGGETEAAE